MSKEKFTKQKNKDKSNDLAGAEYSIFAFEEANDDKILKSTLWVAVGFHIALLLINFPTFQSPEAVEPEKKKIYVVKQVKFKPPKVEKQRIPPKQVKRIPIPDPTPDQPEPLRIDEPEVQIDLPDFDTDVIGIPDAPPAPPMPDGPIYVDGSVQKPVRVHAPQPGYTEVARRARIQGSVIMQAVIDRNGEITELKLFKGLPMGLSEESLKTVKQWKFEPATLRGKPVSVFWTLTVHFKLQ